MWIEKGKRNVFTEVRGEKLKGTNRKMESQRKMNISYDAKDMNPLREITRNRWNLK